MREPSGLRALELHDNSMADVSGTVPWGPGNYPDGGRCTIVFDPTADAQPGDPVVVKMEGSDDAILRILERDGEQYMLRPINPAYATIPLPLNAKIRGVMVEVHILTDAGMRQREEREARTAA
jgi:SOS-response transcriptional repressor LexA